MAVFTFTSHTTAAWGLVTSSCLAAPCSIQWKGFSRLLTLCADITGVLLLPLLLLLLLQSSSDREGVINIRPDVDETPEQVRSTQIGCVIHIAGFTAS